MHKQAEQKDETGDIKDAGSEHIKSSHSKNQ